MQAWVGIDSILKAIFTNRENTAIMLEIFRQSIIMPIKYVDTTRSAISMFRRLFLGSKTQPIPAPVAEQKDKVVGFQRYFIEQLPALFKTESSPQTREQQVTLCLEILQLFKQTFENVSLTAEIRDVLLFTLLEITSTLLKADNPNQELAKSLASVMVDTLLFTWISSKIMNQEMWTRLQEGLQLLFHRIEPIIQMKLKLIQLSLVIRDFIFPPKKKQIKPAEIGENKNRAHAQSLTPDYRKITPNQREPAISSISWDYQSAFFIWNALLQTLRNTNRIKEAAIFSEAVGCISEIIDLFLDAENKAPYNHVIDSEFYLLHQPI